MYQDFIPKLKKTRREGRENRRKGEAKFREENKVRVEENNRRAQTHLIVATLIATVTFAAGFTMPGGYDGNQGPEQGMPVLLRAAAFQAFAITNTIAMICSISAGCNGSDGCGVHYRHFRCSLSFIITSISQIQLVPFSGKK
ncbi:hypothetical protein CsSME_00033597 [Camellia sinensis var. sinensis]